MNPGRLRLALLLLWLPVWLPLAATAAPQRAPHVEVELISEHNGLALGNQANYVALRVRPDPGWHIYWLNPGDSGIPTSLKWELPDQVKAGPIEWPHPRKYRLGSLVNYGYGEETLHLVPIKLGSKWTPGEIVPLRAEAKWLVCKDVCIPGNARVALDLPVLEQVTPQAKWQEDFARARRELPLPFPSKARFAVSEGNFSLALEGNGFEGHTVGFFPEQNDLVDHAAAQRIVMDGQGLRLSQALSSYFVEAPEQVQGVLVLRKDDAVQAFQVTAQPGRVDVVPSVTDTTRKPASEASPALALALVSALLAGLILNLMPCVFPILSLKALALLQAQGQAVRTAQVNALAYTAGVVLSFLAVAGLLLGLRAGGAAVGWGFHLQSPAFVGLLAYVLFALGLSLSGAVQFGSRWMGVGEQLTQLGGPRGAFFTGVLAVVVASPCTVPFMGTAMGYAITQSTATALLVFGTLGFGLALPFLLIAFIPRLARWLPRPGPWMNTFKEAMAFPLYLSAAWLVWVLGRQTDANAAGLVLTGLVLIAFALWLWQRRGWVAAGLRVVALALALLLLFSGPLRIPDQETPIATSADVWSEARVAQLRAEGRTIFVDFTADWCLSCKFNERVALRSDAVQRAFREHQVVFLKADWTRNDPAITRVLERFNRPGVPLYLVYVKGGEPVVLPQLLTPEIVVRAVRP